LEPTSLGLEALPAVGLPALRWRLNRRAVSPPKTNMQQGREIVMTIRIGIYDFFAYTIPGAVYLSAVVYLLHTFQVVSIDFAFADLSIIHIVVVAFLSYITGFIFDPIPTPLWERLFGLKDTSEKVLDKFKQDHPCLDIKFRGSAWPILLAYIRRESVDVASDIEKFNAIAKMFKNVSFGFFVFSVIWIIQALRTNLWPLILALTFLLLSLVAARQGAKFKRWFYSMIYEATVASSLEIDLWITGSRPGTNNENEIENSTLANLSQEYRHLFLGTGVSQG